MQWPQIVMIVVYTLGVAVSLQNHGKPRDPYNMWYTIIGTAIGVFILWAGGFWGPPCH
jgi:hypothetical protein